VSIAIPVFLIGPETLTAESHPDFVVTLKPALKSIYKN